MSELRREGKWDTVHSVDEEVRWTQRQTVGAAVAAGKEGRSACAYEGNDGESMVRGDREAIKEWEEAIAMKAKYEGIRMVLTELRCEVEDREIDSKWEFLELIEEFKEDYFGDEEQAE